MAGATVGADLKIDAAGLRAVALDLRKVSAESAKYLQRRLKTVGSLVAGEAQIAAGWSTRIPASIRANATARSVSVLAGGPRAPHAITFEGRADGGPRRHPVFAQGDRATWTWVAQQPRPFLAVALARKTSEVIDQVAEAVMDAAREAHLA